MTDQTKTQENAENHKLDEENLVAEDQSTEQTEKESAKSEKPKKDKVLKIKESEYNNLVDEAAENKDKYVRLFAEFENARKRNERERMEFVKYANEQLLVDFLGVYDNLELSLQAAKADGQNMEAHIKGMEMVLSQAQEILKKNDVKVIEAKGKPFDPNGHEVLLQEENDEVDEGTVLEELQKGYSYGDRVIRTVKVKVSTKKA